MKYISILRGINVSGHKIIKMELLRKLYEEMGFLNAKSYIQSGNVVFESEILNKTEIEKIISLGIEQSFGFSVPVIVLTVEKLEEIIKRNPFLRDSNKELAYMHVVFLSETPIEFYKTEIEEKTQHNEEICFSDEAIYLYCPNGSGNSKITNTFIETKLKVVATTRNWKTTNEILQLAITVINHKEHKKNTL